MKRQRIHLDTSVIGGCLHDEFAPWSNGLYQDFREGHFVPVVSHLVAAELVLAPQPVQAKYQELLEFETEVLGSRQKLQRLRPSTESIAYCRSPLRRTGFTSHWPRWRPWTSW